MGDGRGRRAGRYLPVLRQVPRRHRGLRVQGHAGSLHKQCPGAFRGDVFFGGTIVPTLSAPMCSAP